MIVTDLIKKLLKKVMGKSSSTDHLSNFNTETNNNIHSIYASLVSIKGHDIEVRENTIIDKDSNLGSYTYVGMNTSITKATIGRYCSIGNNVSIGPGEHDLNKLSTSALFYESPFNTLTQHDCIIGNDVWIGVDSIVKRGVKIGDGAVVGANSVVTKDVPSFAIVIGSPAKLLRFRSDETIIKKLAESHWWNYDLGEAREIQKKIETEIKPSRKL